MSDPSKFKQFFQKLGSGVKDWGNKTFDQDDDGVASSKEIAQWAGDMGLKVGNAAIESVPQAIAANQLDGTKAKSMKEASALGAQKAASMISAGMNVGMAAGGPIGGAIGTAAMAIPGLISMEKTKDDFQEEINKELQEDWTEKDKDLIKRWYNESDSARMKKLFNMLERQRGIIN